MLQHAKARAEERSRAAGGASGGSRPPPRGQRAPFQRGLPRRFQQSAQPFRRFVKGTASDKARLAEEGVEDGVEDDEPPEPEKIQSASILQREAPSMPTTFSTDHFEGKQQNEKAMPLVQFPADFPAEQARPTEGPGPSPSTLPIGTHSGDTIAVGTPIQPPTRPRSVGLLGLIGLLAAIVYALLLAIESAALQWMRTVARTAWDTVPVLVVGLMGGSMTIFIVVLALAGRANALQLTSHVNTLSTPKSLRVIEKVHAITSEHIYLGDTNVKMQRPNGLHLEPGLIEGDGKIFWTVDSGATAICIPVEDEWMLDRVTDAHPNIGVEAADGIQLAVKTVGVINADGLLPGKIGIETYEIKGGRWVKNEEPSYPTMSRVLVTQGLKRGTRLAGVGPLKKDGHWTYFNDDNSASLEDCLKLKNGRYALFTNDPKHYEVVFRVAPMPGIEEARMSRDTRRSSLEVHASLMHCNSAAIRNSYIHISGFNLNTFSLEASACHGCRLGKTTAPPHRRSTAPSRGGTRVPPGTHGLAPALIRHLQGYHRGYAR